MKLTKEQKQKLHREYEQCENMRIAAKRVGVSYGAACVELSPVMNKFESFNEYLNKDFCKRHGYKNLTEYYHALRKRRGPDSKYGKLSVIITDSLEKLNMNQSELAKKIGTSKQVINNYIRKKSFPKDAKKRRKLETALKLKSKSLEEILE